MNNLEKDFPRYIGKNLEMKSTLFRDKLIKNFITDIDNKKILEEAFEYQTSESFKILDRVFKQYYFNVRITSYISTTIYYSAMNFDKKERNESKRTQLILDSPINDASNNYLITRKDLLRDDSQDLLKLIKTDYMNINNFIESPHVIEAIETLTEKQKQILYLVFVEKFTHTEIAEILGVSQQAISKNQAKAINLIRKYLKEGDYYV